MSERTAGDPLVIPLRKPRWALWTFALMSLALAGGSVAWIALSPSLRAFVIGGLMVVSLVWVWITMLAARRARGSAPQEIVATRKELRSPLWELNWDRVDRLWIGRTGGGRLKALNIEPLRPDDVRSAPSGVLRLNAVFAEALKVPAVQILQISIDRPLEELAAQFEDMAGRPLLVRREST